MTWKSFASDDRAAGEKVIRELDEGWQAIRGEMPGSGSYVNEVSWPRNCDTFEETAR